MHIAFAFALVGGIGIFLLRGLTPALQVLGSTPYVWASKGTLLAVPLFILMGQFVFQSGISTELYEAAHKWSGRIHGGLAVATTLACTAFGACCGVSMAACATFGSIAFPEMEKYRYNHGLSTGCIAVGGGLSTLIPPSAPFIIYGALTETSIGKMFIAGIFPGLLLASLYVAVIYGMCKRNPSFGPPGPSYSWKEMLVSLKGVVWALLLFLLVIGGLFAGVFTPSEAGAAGAFGAFILALAKRQLTFSSFVSALRDSLKTTCFILTITMGAMMFSSFLGIAGFTSMFRDWIVGIPLPPSVIMMCILFIYIPLGMVMDVMAMILLTLPIVFPIAVELGFDPVWFGLMLAMMGEMGVITPPVGMNAYVVSGVTKVPLEEVFRGIIPFFLMILIGIILMFAFPQIILFLPSIM
jgi:tripartite ATP-independent transporter DctM subunit